jgi:hypothetical protein
MRLEVRSQRSEVFMSSWRSKVSNLKCETFCLRFKIFLCKVKGQRF